MHLTLVPAFGRDYKSKAEVQRDLDAGKDFIIATYGHRYDGKPANAESLRQAGVKTVNIRYKQQRSVGVFRVPGTSSLSSNPVFSGNPIDTGSAVIGGFALFGALWVLGKIVKGM